MRFVYGLVGAVLGVIVLAAAAYLAAALMAQGDGLGVALFTAVFGLPAICVGAVAGVIISQLVCSAVNKARLAGARHRARYLITGWVVAPLLLTPMFFWGESRVEDANPNSLAQRPSDVVLLAQFAKHRATLEKINQMVLADRGLTRVDQDWTNPSEPATVGVSVHRIAQYRSLLRSAGVPRGFQTDGAGREVDYFYWLTGYAITSEADTGYAYLEAPPKQIAANLSDVPYGGSAEVKLFRPIQGHWYLFYEYEPD